MIRHEYTIPPVNYKSSEAIESPYFRARQEWDNRLGSEVVRGKNWRVAFFLACALSLVLAGTNVYQVLSIKVHPVVITVSSETGQPNVLGKIQDVKYIPKEQEIKFFIGQFIQNIRAVPSDPVVIKKNWFNAYSFLKTKASNYLNQLTQKEADGPLSKIGIETVTIKPISVLRVNGSNSYQARWREFRFDQGGTLKEEYNMTGVFTIKFETPENMEILSMNPLGIFIEDFQWNKEL